jgi:molybdate-binding protein/DNA-binding XRE family transcriptional regulator
VASRGEASPLRTGLREARLRAGLSQQQLADAAGVSRQTVAGLESGAYGPSVAVALRLAAALGTGVEELFWLAEPERVRARWAVATPAAAPGRTQRVHVAEVGEAWLAWPIPAGRTLSVAADGLLDAADPPDAAGHVSVRLLRPLASLRHTVVVAGCEPALALLAQHAFRGGPRALGRALWAEMPNAAAIDAVTRGVCHVAAVHGVERAGAAFDLGLGVPVVPPAHCRVFHLARSRHGWIFAPGLAFHGAGDLATGRFRLVNRPPGSGARALLDRTLAAAGLEGSAIPGYTRVAAGQLELAAAIADGAADVGVGAESAAAAHGLGFLPLQEEGCDLWVPRAHCELPAVSELLAALGDGAFRADLSAAAPYDTAATGGEWTPPLAAWPTVDA